MKEEIKLNKRLILSEKFILEEWINKSWKSITLNNIHHKLKLDKLYRITNKEKGTKKIGKFICEEDIIFLIFETLSELETLMVINE